MRYRDIIVAATVLALVPVAAPAQVTVGQIQAVRAANAGVTAQIQSINPDPCRKLSPIEQSLLQGWENQGRALSQGRSALIRQYRIENGNTTTYPDPATGRQDPLSNLATGNNSAATAAKAKRDLSKTPRPQDCTNATHNHSQNRFVR